MHILKMNRKCIFKNLLLGIDGSKLLGVAEIPPKTTDGVGEIISDKTVGFLNSWNCAGTVRYMVFDTTSANTGKIMNVKTIFH